MSAVVVLLARLRRALWSNRHGRERRRLLLLLHLAQALLLYHRIPAGQRQSMLDPLGVVLHEPTRRCRCLLLRHFAEIALIEERRNRCRSGSEIRHYRQSIALPRRQEHAGLLRETGRSRIIVSYHFGDYVHCLNRIAELEGDTHRRILIRKAPGSESGFLNEKEEFRQLRVSEPETVLSDEVNLLSMRRRLRHGICSVITFCDLSSQSGRVTRVRFLGHQAWFSSGAAHLAVSAGVPMVPVITYHDGRCHKLIIHSMMESARRPRESVAAAVQRLTQGLIAILEYHLLRYPWQWRYLSALPLYLQAPQRGGDGHDRE